MKVIITGGAGFIGTHLYDELKKEHDVAIIDDTCGGILNKPLLNTAFNNTDYVFHLAAVSNAEESLANPSLTNEININGTVNVLTVARDCGVRKVIFASSAAVYNLINPYAISKLAGEYYCRMFTDLYELPTVCLRYFNVYGNGSQGVVSKFISNPVIYGSGEQVRDYIYIDDIVQASIWAMGDVTGVADIGTGVGTSLNQLAELMNVKPTHTDARDGDAMYSVAKPSVFHTKWTLKEGLRELRKS